MSIRDPDRAVVLTDLRSRAVNYDYALAPPQVTTGWHQDREVVALGSETPGEPVPQGLARTASALLDSYEFVDPRIMRASWRDGALLGRDMLLEGRFGPLRFLMGVRITEHHDEIRPGSNGPERVTGWSYDTLHGHLEQGRLTYEIVKQIDTGRVEFRITGHSRRAPIANPVLRLGFALFGRRTQLLFYRQARHRLARFAAHPPRSPRPGPDGIVHAPAGIVAGRFEHARIRFLQPAQWTAHPITWTRPSAWSRRSPLPAGHCYAFAWRSPFTQLLRLLGVTDHSSGVWVHGGTLDARFGHWRVHTALSNIASVQTGGPYKAYRAIGPRLSLADRGLTFGTNPANGVCIVFHRPVRGLDPWGLLHHPSLTVTVSQPDQLVAALHTAPNPERHHPAATGG